MFTAPGTFSKRLGGIYINDNQLAKVGEKVCYRCHNSFLPRVITGIIRHQKRDIVNGTIFPDEYVVVLDDDSTVDPSDLFAIPSGVKINGGKNVNKGDIVWMWRCGAAPALVCKRAVSFAVEGRTNYVKCTYTDHLWVRKERATNLYATEAEAIKARPELAKKLEHALIRAGRLQGYRKAA